MHAWLTLLIVISTKSFALSIDGHYDLVKGTSKCPTGVVQTKANRLIFGSRHVWMLVDSSEKVEGGCSYDTKIKKFDHQIEITTTRSSCPNKVENGVTNESLQLQKGILVYNFSSSNQSKKNEFQCVYTAVKAK